MKFPHLLVIISFISFFITMTGCSTAPEANADRSAAGESCEPGTGVEFYLIESFSTLLNTDSRIDEDNIITGQEPLIRYEDLLRYNSEAHAFTISQKAEKAIQNLEHSVRGVPFAVLADRELVYTGYFWPAYSSVSCDWMVIDPLSISADHEMRIRPGYPALRENNEIPDRRNDERILNIFKRDGKLLP